MVRQEAANKPFFNSYWHRGISFKKLSVGRACPTIQLRPFQSGPMVTSTPHSALFLNAKNAMAKTMASTTMPINN
jgi:hypothetical protein